MKRAVFRSHSISWKRKTYYGKPIMAWHFGFSGEMETYIHTYIQAGLDHESYVAVQDDQGQVDP